MVPGRKVLWVGLPVIVDCLKQVLWVGLPVIVDCLKQFSISKMLYLIGRGRAIGLGGERKQKRKERGREDTK